MFIISTTYKDLPGTEFPDSIDTYEKLSDITLGTLQYALQYSSLYNQGRLEEAYSLLEQYPELKRCIVNADKINKLIDAIKAIETYGLETGRNVSSITNTVNGINKTVTSLNTNVTNINTTVSTLNTKVEHIEQTTVTVTKESIGLGNVNNTADANKSVKYATSAGSASNSDTVDGFHITISTADLTAGSSPLTTNVFCFVYE